MKFPTPTQPLLSSCAGSQGQPAARHWGHPKGFSVTCTVLCTCVALFPGFTRRYQSGQVSRVYQSVSESPFPLFFLSGFIVAHLWAPVSNARSGNCSVKKMACDCFQQMFWGYGLSLSRLWVRSCKDTPWKWNFTGSCRTGWIMAILWGFGGFQTCSAPFLCCRMLFFIPIVVAGLLLFKASTELGTGRWEIG